MTANKQILLSGVTLCVFLLAGAAQAQSLGGTLNQSQNQTPSNFARDRAISVTQRQHPGYEALGVRAGAFMLWPKLTVTSEYNDNIFATNSDQVADGISHIAPEVDLSSNWSRHSLTAYARGVLNQYWQNSNQNTNDFSVGARGELDVQRTAVVNAGADYSRLTEPRTSASSQGNAFPIQYDLTSFYVSGSKEFNRLRFSGRVDWMHYDYMDRAGNFPQEDRNRDTTIGLVRGDYALSPDTAVFVEVAANNRNYKLSSSPIENGVPLFPAFINRDSNGIQVLAGANFELGALVRGELGVGYLKQNYKDSGFGDVSGPGARVQLEWFPTQLTTVTVTGARTIEDAGIAGASSYTSNNYSARVDHELLRNVLLNASAGYGKDDYQGLDRRDTRFIAGLGATYLMNRNIGLTLGYSYYKQDSSGSDTSVLLSNFTINRITAGITLQY